MNQQMPFFKKAFKILYDSIDDTIHHDGVEHAGYIAFLSILSLFPFLVFLVAFVGFIGHTEIGLKITQFILENQIIPADVITALKPRVDEIASGPPQGLLTISIVGAIWTASSTVEGLRTILNRAYRVTTPPAYILRRLLSIAQFLVLTGIIIGVTFIFVIAPGLWSKYGHVEYIARINEFFSTSDEIISAWHYFRYIITTVTLFIVVCIAYYVIPNIRQKWIYVTPGALAVIILWFISGSLFSAYLNNFDQVNIIYGSLGSFIAALLFFYLSATIFIFGAELNYHIEKALGFKTETKE